MDSSHPYVKSTQVFACPSVPSASKTGHQYYYSTAVSGFHRSRYGFPVATTAHIPAHQSEIRRPAENVLIVESTRDACGSDGQECATPYDTWANYDSSQANREAHIWRHLAGMNIAFVDGHVKWFGYVRDAGITDSASSTSYSANRYWNVWAD